MRSVKEINEELQQYDLYVQALNYEECKDMQVLCKVIIDASSMLARSASLVADSQKLLADAKKNAYHTWLLSAKAQGIKMSPMLVRDYVNAQFAEELQCSFYSDRVNRMLTHVLQSLNCVLSAEKAEMLTLKYQT